MQTSPRADRIAKEKRHTAVSIYAIQTSDVKPVVDHQRRLNPKMKDVVRNEILKLLDAGIIYPIANSRWVSPIHCVPIKGRYDCGC